MKKKTRMALKYGYELTITTAKEKVAAQRLVNQDGECDYINCVNECPFNYSGGSFWRDSFCAGISFNGDVLPERFDKYSTGRDKQVAVLNEMGYRKEK